MGGKERCGYARTPPFRPWSMTGKEDRYSAMVLHLGLLLDWLHVDHDGFERTGIKRRCQARGAVGRRPSSEHSEVYFCEGISEKKKSGSKESGARSACVSLQPCARTVRVPPAERGIPAHTGVSAPPRLKWILFLTLFTHFALLRLVPHHSVISPSQTWSSIPEPAIP